MAAAAAAARQFATAAAGGAEAAARAPLTMVTYNVLADKFATGGWHSYCPPQFLEWSYRGPRIIEELLRYDADILCLQEVERPFYDGELVPAFEQRGYELLYYGRQTRPREFVQGPEEGIALLFRKERLQRMASRAVRFGDLVAPGLAGGFWQRMRDLGEGAIWALLHDKQAGQPLLVGCTHLFWDPKHPDAKVVQAHLLCQVGRELLERAGLVSVGPYMQGSGGSLSPLPADAGSSGGAGGGARLQAPGIPVLLGGDFNSLPAKWVSDAFDTVPPGGKLVSGVYTLLSEGSLGPTHPDHPAVRRPGDQGNLAQLTFHTSGLRLGSMLAEAWGADPPITNNTATFAGCLDYLWASNHWQPLAALELPYGWDRGAAAASDPAAVHGLPPMPNEQQPSDHLAVGARLALRAAAG